MKEVKITAAANGEEKRNSYAIAKVNYKRAISGGFYGEALLIDYAIIEDRLKSLLYYSGAMIEKNDPKVEIDNPDFISAYSLTTDDDESGNSTDVISVRDISKKIIIIECMLKKLEKYSGDDEYYLLMKRAMGSDEIIKTFRTKISKLKKEWLPCRNEIIHGLVNKNVGDLYEKYQNICDRGMEYADYFDNRIRAFKDHANIREFWGLKTDQ